MNDIAGRNFDVGIADMLSPASIEREFTRSARRVLARAPARAETPVPKRLHARRRVAPRVPRRKAVVARLLDCAGADFVDRVYADLLGRAPDRDGRAYYRSLPTEGDGARLAIIAAIRLSAEGRRARTRLVGLRLRHVATLLLHCTRGPWLPISPAGEACM